MRGWEPLRLLWNGYCSPLKGGFCSGPGVLNIRQIKVFISLSQKGFLRSLEWLLVPGKILGRSPGFVTLLWLVVVRQQDGVTGICHQPSDFTQSGVHMLVLSLKLPSSTWRGGLGGALVSVEELWALYQITRYIPSGATRTLLHDCTVVS